MKKIPCPLPFSESVDSAIVIPSEPGTYILTLWLRTPIRLRVGRLGELAFRRGYYYYCGSALGPGGLASRINRHLKLRKSLHWHIDYLRAKCEIRGIHFVTGKTRRECAWARLLPFERITGFGSSDCRCKSHLLYTQRLRDVRRILAV